MLTCGAACVSNYPCVKVSVNSSFPVYFTQKLCREVAHSPGIDIDIPTGLDKKRTQPEDVKAATFAAFRAGAPGVIISRKYAEMKLTNIAGAMESLRGESSPWLAPAVATWPPEKAETPMQSAPHRAPAPPAASVATGSRHRSRGVCRQIATPGACPECHPLQLPRLSLPALPARQISFILLFFGDGARSQLIYNQ